VPVSNRHRNVPVGNQHHVGQESSAMAESVLAPSRRRSYAFCERLARAHAGNFYHGFRLLPQTQRRGMCALYSFLRVADDLADGDDPVAVKRRMLDDWRQQLDDALAGHYRHPLHAALHDTIARHGVPRVYLDAVLDGVGMDLDTTRYETFADLYSYCYRVASAVGLACIHLWGFTAEEARGWAEAAGIAFQLTNILRDLAEDAARGRIYLPGEDLAHFEYDETSLTDGVVDERFRALMRFETARAYSYYAEGERLAPLLHPPGRAVFLVLLRTYRGLLDAIVRRNYDIFRGRVRLSSWQKFWLTARALPVRWGWG
jgi:phytoene synthase